MGVNHAMLPGCTDYRVTAQLINDGGYATDTVFIVFIPDDNGVLQCQDLV